MRTLTRPLIIILLALFAALAITRVPYGQWDAWATWNTLARLLYYNDMADVYRYSAILHRDYPPLLYLIILNGFKVFGDTIAVPIAVSGMVYAGLLWLVRKPFWALLIVGMVALRYALQQYADLPLALAFLGAVVAYRHNKPLWVGVAMGIGLLLKNEGALIAVCFISAWAVSERRLPMQALITLLPFAALLMLFKAVVAVPNDLTSSAGILERATNMSRYGVMLPLLLQGVIEFGGGVFVVTGAVLAINRERVRWSVPLVVCGLVLVGYVGTYAITPYDIAHHIETSWDRLILHVFPIIVYELTKAPRQGAFN